MNIKKFVMSWLFLLSACSIGIVYASQDSPAASLSVESSPSGADIWIDGFSTGKTTPYCFSDLVGYSQAYSDTLSMHYITVKKDGYPIPCIQKMDLEAGKKRTAIFNLPGDTGSIRVESRSTSSSQFNEALIGNEFTSGGTAKNWRADDQSYFYTLPFTFNFYSSYNSVYVCTNGYLNFTNSSPFSNLTSSVMIAPFYKDLMTNGSGQPGEDIYISSTSTSVTIRWCAESYGSNRPANFSVTLYKSTGTAKGNIKFNYGSGNTNIYPTVGVSYGDNYNYISSSKNGSSNLANAQTSLITTTSGAASDRGADIYLDGIYTGLQTPCTFYNLITGSHYVTVRHNNLTVLPGQKCLNVTKDNTSSVNFTPESNSGYLDVFNNDYYDDYNPFNAYIDGVEEGQGNYYFSNNDLSRSNPHWIVLRKDGCFKNGVLNADFTYSDYVYTNVDFFKLVSSVQIEKNGYFSADADAEVSVNDIYADTDPFSINTVTVTAVSPSDTGETIQLTETDVDSGLFEGILAFESSAVYGNDKVAVKDGEYFTIKYRDPSYFSIKIDTSYYNAHYTSSDLVLKKEITPEFLEYLKGQEEEFLALPENDSRNLSLALIQIGYINLILQDKVTRGQNILNDTQNTIENIETIIENEFSDISWNPGSSLVDKQAIKDILTKLKTLMDNEKWENEIRPKIARCFVNLDNTMSNIEPFLTSIFDYSHNYDNFKDIEQAASDYRYYISRVSTANFNYEVELDTGNGGSSVWTLNGQDINNLLADADELSIHVSTGMDFFEHGFQTIHDGYNNNGDTVTIRLGRNQLIDGLLEIEAGVDKITEVLDDVPFSYYNPDKSVFNNFKAKSTILREVINGKTYLIGQDKSKTICPVAWLDSLPEDLTKLIVEYYSLPSKTARAGYTFAGLFPEGLPPEIVNALEPSPYFTLNVFTDTGTFKQRMDEAETYYNGVLSSNPDDPKANMSMVFIKYFELYKELPDKIQLINTALNENDFVTFCNALEDIDAIIDPIRAGIDKLAANDSQFIYTIILKYTRNDNSPYEVNINDEFFPVPVPSLLLTEMKSWIDFIGTLFDVLSNQGEDFENFPYDMSLNPNLLNFSGCEYLQDYINALRVANPDFLKLKTVEKNGVDGETIIENIGKGMTDLADSYAIVSEFIYKVSCEAKDNMTKTVNTIDNNMYDGYVGDMLSTLDEMRLAFNMFYQDFKYPLKYTEVYEDFNINLSAWFDNVPTDILSMIEEYFINEAGTMGGLFPKTLVDTPQAEAGNNICIIEDTEVTLHGEESYTFTNNPLSYQWSFVVGPKNVSLTNAESANPRFTPTEPGTYKFKLVVSDGQKTSAPDYVWVTVNKAVISNIAGGSEKATSQYGDVIVNVPAGVFNENVVIAIQTNPIENPMEINPAIITSANTKGNSLTNIMRLEGTIVEFNAYDLSSSNRIRTFSGEIEIIIPYKDSNNDGIVDDTSPQLKEENLQIYRLDETAENWVVCEAPSTVDGVKNCVKTMVNHFSVFTLMSISNDSSNIVVYPNPFKPGTNGQFDAPYITFNNIALDATIDIYNIAGKLVKTLENTDKSAKITWDIKLDDSGSKAASGIYLYVIKDGSGNNTTGKFTIIK